MINLLTKRQIDIISHFEANYDSSFTVKKLSELFSIGQRSIVNDIQQINSIISAYGASIKKNKNKEYFLEILNNESNITLITKLVNEQQKYHFNDQSSRINYILFRLLNETDYIKSTVFENEMYISKSTITSDLAIVRNIISKYDLTLDMKPHFGLKLNGSEANKRLLISERNVNLYLTFFNEITAIYNTDDVSQLLTEILLKHQFKISDIVFQNLLIHLLTSIVRIKKGFYLEGNSKLSLIYYHAMNLSTEIYKRCSLMFHIPYIEEEAKYLAIELQCKREYDQQDSIDEEISSFILRSLKAIRDKFNIDFTSDMNLRISLALHTKPLISRLESNIQLTNIMTLDIKQRFAFQYDLASEYAFQLFKKYNIKLCDDEISYITLHFIVAMKKVDEAKLHRRILLVSEQRKSNTILIQQQILQWFKDEVRIIHVANKLELAKFNMLDYDAIVTTDQQVLSVIPNAVYINFFPTEKDHLKIELALNGITKSKDVLYHFHPELFFYGDVESKDDMIRILCSKSEKLFDTNDELYESCLLHESIANTFFGNHIAIPHPDQPITDESFICVGIPKEPIQWQNDVSIKLVLLVSIEKDKPRALQIWQYLYYLISDEEMIHKIISNPNYESFIELVSNFYCELLDK